MSEQNSLKTWDEQDEKLTDRPEEQRLGVQLGSQQETIDNREEEDNSFKKKKLNEV